MNRIFARCCLVALGIASLSNPLLAEPAAGDEAAIRQVLMSTWDKPGAPLAVEPVVIEADHALAGWSQGARGGRALLARQPDGRWTVQVCGGDTLLDSASLERSALPPATARALAAATVRAEAKLPAARRALFSTFGAPRDMTGGARASDAPHRHR